MTEDDARRLAALPDEAIVSTRQGDNGLWYATVQLERNWVGDPDFSTCGSTAAEAIRQCASRVCADLRGEGKYAPHWSSYDVTFKLIPHWEQRAKVKAKANKTLTEAKIKVLYTRAVINRATWNNALRSFHGDHGHVGQQAIATCEIAIEAIVERAIDAACAVIQDKLGVKTGDLAAQVLSDGTIERELTRYLHAELDVVDTGHEGDL